MIVPQKSDSCKNYCIFDVLALVIVVSMAKSIISNGETYNKNNWASSNVEVFCVTEQD